MALPEPENTKIDHAKLDSGIHIRDSEAAQASLWQVFITALVVVAILTVFFYGVTEQRNEEVHPDRRRPTEPAVERRLSARSASRRQIRGKRKPRPPRPQETGTCRCDDRCRAGGEIGSADQRVDAEPSVAPTTASSAWNWLPSSALLTYGNTMPPSGSMTAATTATHKRRVRRLRSTSYRSSPTPRAKVHRGLAQRLIREGRIDRHAKAVGEPVGFVRHADHAHQFAEHRLGHAGLARRRRCGWQCNTRSRCVTVTAT